MHFGFIAQLAEHKTENLGVVGSIPTEATRIANFPLSKGFFVCNLNFRYILGTNFL